ncbi:MAG: hypothetical protein R3362_07105 [Rhodothermales bacterium]|nr:hypothetical protein [Rhodothermales bacterium]
MDLLDYLEFSASPSLLHQDRVHFLLRRLSPEPARLVREEKEIAAVAAVRRETGASLQEALAVVGALRPWDPDDDAPHPRPC